MSSLVDTGRRATTITPTTGLVVIERINNKSNNNNNPNTNSIGKRKQAVVEDRLTTTSTTGSTQLPSPLPSPPPQLSLSASSLSSSSSSSKSQRLSDHLSNQAVNLVISNSTPPQSPFMLDDKQITTTPLNSNKLPISTASVSSPTTTTTPTTTPTEAEAATITSEEIVADSSEPSATTTATTATTKANTAASTSTSTQVDVEAHTPPESNDGTETQLRLADLNAKLARFNSLNHTFQRSQASLGSALDSSARRLRSIHVACFNRHVAAYLDRKQQQQTSKTDDQVVGDEIAYEIGRRRDDRRKHEDEEDDDDETISSSSSSSSSEDENDVAEDDDDDEDQLIVDGESSRGLENDFYFRTTGDVHSIDGGSVGPTDQRIRNRLSADDYWSMQRVRLGGEWERVQAKLKYLKHTNEQLDKHLASEREIEKLSQSLKESIKQTFSTSSTGGSVLDDDEHAPDVSDDDEDDNSDQEELVIDDDDYKQTSRRVHALRPSRQHHRRSSVHSFDELALIKSFYLTLMHFRTTLFKRTCLCDNDNTTTNNNNNNRRRQQRRRDLGLDKTCIFCHMFKKYDSHLVQQLPTTTNINTITAPNNISTQFIRADERVIRLYHSYCKQPKYGDKLNWSTCPAQRSRKEAQLDDHDDDFNKNNNNNSNEEDYLDLSRLVSERLNKLLSGRQQRDDNSKEAKENEEAAAAAEAAQKNLATHSPRDELDEIVIDPGYEISLDDINKLPDFSYEELKFLCEDLSIENPHNHPQVDGNKRKELDSSTTGNINESNNKRARLANNSDTCC